MADPDPHTGYQKESEKGVANGYAPLGPDNLVPSIHLPPSSSGKLVNRWVATSTTTGSTTNILPYDDTVPQSTEGAEFLTVSVSPSSASNRLKVTVSGWYRVSGAAFVGCALFVGSAASAVASRPMNQLGGALVLPFDLVFWINSFSGTETLRFRMGTDRNTITLQFLNASGAVYYGATDPAMILVEEIAP